MQTIEIDFEVFKALTARREAETVSYNDVLRQLLGLGEYAEIAATNPLSVGEESATGFFALRGAKLPNGAKLRATYKGNLYTAEIRNNRWIDSDGVEHQSPSAAARHVTGTNVNGWRFWEVKRPSDAGWRKLDTLVGTRFI